MRERGSERGRVGGRVHPGLQPETHQHRLVMSHFSRLLIAVFQVQAEINMQNLLHCFGVYFGNSLDK